MFTVKIEGEPGNQELVIRAKLGSPAPSASGKTMVVASSRGNQKTAVEIDGKPVTLGFNAYIPKG